MLFTVIQPVQVSLVHGWSDQADPSGLGQWNMKVDGRRDQHPGKKDQHLFEREFN